MSCSFDQDLLQDYLENTIDPLEKIVLLEHLKVCSACRRELTELKLLYWEINNLPYIDLPKEALNVKSSVINKIKENNSTMEKYNLKKYLSVQSNTIENASIFFKFIPGTKKTFNLIDSISTTILGKGKSAFSRGLL